MGNASLTLNSTILYSSLRSGPAALCLLPQRTPATPKTKNQMESCLNMSSPTLNQSVFAVDTVAHTIPEASADRAVECGVDAAMTARAVVMVTLLGAGFWYL